MIELPVFAVAILGVLATIGFITTMGRLLSSGNERNTILDESVNSKQHLLSHGFTSQSHRDR